MVIFRFQPYFLSGVLQACLLFSVNGQQLVVLKKDNVILRLERGDGITYQLKNSEAVKRATIINLTDGLIQTDSSSIDLGSIDRIYFRHSNSYNDAGVKLTFAGIVLFLADQFNSTVIQDQKPSINGTVLGVSIAFVAVGVPMMLIKKKSEKMSYKYRVMIVKTWLSTL